MQSDSAKSDGPKSVLKIRWPKSSGFVSKPDESAHRILKSKKASVFYSNTNLTEQSMGYTACRSSSTRYMKQAVRIAIDALNYEYNHGVRTQSPRLSTDRLQLSGDAGSDVETKSSAPIARLS